MKKLIAMLAVVVLSGCVSPADLKKSEPSFSAVTKKDPKSYALCVFPQWQEARNEAVMSETVDGYRLIVAAEQLTDELLEVRKSAGGSEVQLFQRVPWMPGVGRSAIEAAVKSCL